MRSVVTATLTAFTKQTIEIKRLLQSQQLEEQADRQLWSATRPGTLRQTSLGVVVTKGEAMKEKQPVVLYSAFLSLICIFEASIIQGKFHIMKK